MADRESERFPRRARVVKSSDYRSIYAAGRKLDSSRFVLYARVNTLEEHRLGLTVSRKIGEAVVRNRVKRLFREIFRRCRSGIPGHHDLVVNAKRGCATASYPELRDEFLSAARRLCR